MNKTPCLLFIFLLYSVSAVAQFSFNNMDLYDSIGNYSPTNQQRLWSYTFETGINVFDGDITQQYNSIIPTSQTKFSFGATMECDFTPFFGIGVEFYYLPLAAGSVKANFNGTLLHLDPFMSINLLNLFQMYSNRWGVYGNIGGGFAYYNTTLYKNGTIFDHISNGFAITLPISGLVEYNLSKTFAIGAKFQYALHNKDNLEGTNLPPNYGGYNFKGVSNDNVALAALYLRIKIGAVKHKHTRNMRPTPEYHQNVYIQNAPVRSNGGEEKKVIIIKENAKTPQVKKPIVLNDTIRNVYVVGKIYVGSISDSTHRKTLKPGKYILHVNPENTVVDTVINRDSIKHTVPELYIHVYDIDTKKNLDAKVTVSPANSDKPLLVKANKNDSGIISSNLVAGKYQLNVTKQNYLYQILDINHVGPDTLNIGLKMIHKGGSMVLKNLYFNFDSDVIKNSSEPELNVLYQFMKENPNLIIEVVGYTDNIGSFSYNKKLSTNRANSVREALIKMGVNQHRIYYAGRGESKPLAANGTRQGRAKNRRVEIVILN